MIVSADDYGKNQNVTDAIYQSFLNGYINYTCAMVNMPFIEYGYNLIKETKFLKSIGLHINLTEGSPLTDKIKHFKHWVKNGCFFKKSSKDRLIIILFSSKAEREAVYEEIEAQIYLFRKLGFTGTHLDSHHHIHTISFITRFLEKKGNNYNFDRIRLSQNIYKNDTLNIFKRFYKFILNKKIIAKGYNTVSKFGQITDYRASIEYNSTSEIMCHPVLKNDVLLDIGTKCEMKEFKNLASI